MDAKRSIKVVVEEHADGFIAYPVGLAGACVGQGETYEEALADVRSAIAAHIEVFGEAAFQDEASE